MLHQKRRMLDVGCKAICCLMLLVFSSCTTLSAQEAPKELMVLSWNIQLLPRSFSMFSKGLRKKQRLRTPWIIEHCQEHAYDVIVFQEVFDKPLAKKLQQELLEAYPYQVKPLRKVGRFTSSGILIVSKWPIKQVGSVVYTKGVHEDALAAKGCTVVEVQQGVNTLYIAGTHLQAGGSIAAQRERSKQYKAIHALLEQVTNDSLAVVLAGDLNTRKTAAQAYPEMLSVLQMKDYPLEEERPFTIDNQNTWNREATNKQLDYILLRAQKSAVQIRMQKVLRLQKIWKEQPLDLADHYGIIATLQWGIAPSNK